MHDPTKAKYRYMAFNGKEKYRRFIKGKESLEKGKLSDFNPEIPAHGSYGYLLFDPKWKLRRLQIMTRDKNVCVNCKSGKSLQVHHRQYHFLLREKKFRMPWEYPDHLLITLCEPCHQKGHNKFKVPTINI